ncbi:hypothetical protein BJ508DRAFT_331854 [Ascobolus immersus RN42]|uniref:Uncharacterized protein n=1 Tax=Ascobolus immersus RN42 TaxID=1160509 RepID=A0A3N4HV87_ASCIM|nr:hypothetical protein BJ508DRAFT_331854 [Ascobolus immersus RN42]
MSFVPQLATRVGFYSGVRLTNVARFSTLIKNAHLRAFIKEGRERAENYDWLSETFKNNKYFECRQFEFVTKLKRLVEQKGAENVTPEEENALLVTREDAEKKIDASVWHTDTIIDDILEYIQLCCYGGKEGRVEEQITASTLTLTCTLLLKLYIQKTDQTKWRANYPQLVKRVEEMRHWCINNFALSMTKADKTFLGYLELKLMVIELMPAVESEKEKQISYEFAISCLASFSVAFFTGTRTGTLYLTPAYHQRHFKDPHGELHTLCWKDVSFKRVLDPAGKFRVQLELTLRWYKGHHMTDRIERPHHFSPIQDADHIFTDPALWFLQLAIKMNVLDIPEYKDVEELIKHLREPGGKLGTLLLVKEEWKNRPVFCIFGSQGQPMIEKPATTSHVSPYLKTILRVCRLPANISFYGWRYEFVDRSKRMGVNDDTIRALMGHVENSTVMNAAYSRVTNNIDVVGFTLMQKHLPKSAHLLGKEGTAPLQACFLATVDQETAINDAISKDEIYRGLIARLDYFPDHSSEYKEARIALPFVVKTLKAKARRYLRQQWKLAETLAKTKPEDLDLRTRNLHEKNPLVLRPPTASFPAELDPHEETEEITSEMSMGMGRVNQVLKRNGIALIGCEPVKDKDVNSKEKATVLEVGTLWYDTFAEMYELGQRNSFQVSCRTIQRCPFNDLGMICTMYERSAGIYHDATDKHMMHMIESSTLAPLPTVDALKKSVFDFVKEHGINDKKRYLDRAFYSYIRTSEVMAVVNTVETPIEGATKSIIQLHHQMIYEVLRTVGRVTGDVAYAKDNSGRQQGLYEFFGSRFHAPTVGGKVVRILDLDSEPEDRNEQQAIEEESYSDEYLERMCRLLQILLALVVQNYKQRIKNPTIIGLVSDDWRARIVAECNEVLNEVLRDDLSFLETLARLKQMRTRAFSVEVQKLVAKAAQRLTVLGCPDCFLHQDILELELREGVNSRMRTTKKTDLETVESASVPLPRTLLDKVQAANRKNAPASKDMSGKHDYPEAAVKYSVVSGAPMLSVGPSVKTHKNAAPMLAREATAIRRTGKTTKPVFEHNKWFDPAYQPRDEE